jgi:hypothetical protein
MINISYLFFYQLRKLAYAIKRSTTILLPRWNEILQELATAAATTDKKPLPTRIMPRDVSTRWNSTYDMLKFAYAYREAIDKITGERAMKLREYELLESEWETVKQLRDSLKVWIYIYFHYYSTDLAIQVFKQVTLEFSTDTPCTAAVIPAMDKMHTDLTAAVENVEYSPALQAALSLGKDVLDKYYSLSDESEVYRIAMGDYYLTSLRNISDQVHCLFSLASET